MAEAVSKWRQVEAEAEESNALRIFLDFWIGTEQWTVVMCEGRVRKKWLKKTVPMFVIYWHVNTWRLWAKRYKLCMWSWCRISQLVLDLLFILLACELCHQWRMHNNKTYHRSFIHRAPSVTSGSLTSSINNPLYITWVWDGMTAQDQNTTPVCHGLERWWWWWWM